MRVGVWCGSAWSAWSAGSRSFICGTLSPVSDASLITAEPRRITQSQGTTCEPSTGGGGGGGAAAAGVAAAPAAAAPPAAAGVTAVAAAGLASLLGLGLG